MEVKDSCYRKNTKICFLIGNGYLTHTTTISVTDEVSMTNKRKINADVDEISKSSPNKTISVAFIFRLIKLAKGKVITADLY